jgi:thymidylate synthase
MNEITGNSIPEIVYKTVLLITDEGETFTDQRGDLIQEVEDLSISIPAHKCTLHTDPLQARLGVDFAHALKDDDAAKERGEGFVYGYGWEAREENGVEKTYDLLKSDPNTRRAYIPLFKSRHIGQEDIPCFVGLQFRIRNISSPGWRKSTALNLTAFSRSNETAIAMQNDIYGFTEFQKWMAGRLGIPAGNYCQHVGSAHLRIKSEADLINKILREGY